MRRAILGTMIALLLLSMFTLAFNIKPARSALDPPAVEWNQTFGGAGEERAFSMIQTSDSGYALAGSTTSLGVSTVLLVKTDAAGNMQWNRTYGRQQQPNGDLAQSVIQTSDGGYALAGASWNQARGAHDLFMVKTDAGGNTQWNLTYIRDTSGGYLDWGHAFSVIQTNDGGYMVGAGVRHHPDHPTGDWDGWLVKTDANGTVQWDKPYGGSSDEGVHKVLQTSDSGYIFVGTTLSYGAGSGDVWLVKTDATGNQQWVKTFGGPSWDDGRSIARTSDGGYIIGPATSSFGAGSWDFWLIKTDVNGNQQWNKTFGGANEDIAWSVIEAINGGYALAGSTESFGAGDGDFWMVKTDSLGNQEWNGTFGGANYDDARSIVQTVDRGYAVAGYTDSFGAGSYDFLLVKFAGTGPRTWIVDDDGPADFATIQEAINAASEGDTVFVFSGTYYEHLVVNKTLTLQGENRNTTIVDGEYLFASVVNVTANNVKLSGFTIQHCSGGGRALWLDNYGNMTFSHNIITGCNEGVRLHRSSGNVVSDNIVQDCYYNTGVGIDYGINNTVHRNTIINNTYGLSGGIDCHGNTFSENTIINNDIGFGTTSYDNKFFHNNFVNNGVQVIASGINQFDDGYPSGGNYWSDYVGEDLRYGANQSETGSDGIRDTPYIIDSNNRDSYPLMRPYVPFENQTIYIRADGSIDPSGAPIHRIGNLYSLTTDISSYSDGIVVERDNTVIDGANYLIDGHDRDFYNGVTLEGRENVTIRNMVITSGFMSTCIYLNSSSNNFVLANDLTSDFRYGHGLMLDYSSNNVISGNEMTGISGLIYSNNNLISGNNITGSYYEGLGVSGSNNSIIGNNIQDINNLGLSVSGSNNRIIGNNITNNGIGIELYSSSNNSVSGNNIVANYEYGIWLSHSSGNSVNGNNIADNGAGIYIVSSSNNSISGNMFFNDGLMVHSSGNVVADNLVNGRPLVYLEGVSDYVVEDAGQVILVDCNRIRVENLNLSHTSIGVELWQTNNTKISGNNITANNNDGIYLGYYSSNNSVSENNITANNGYGIELYSSSFNSISGNNVEANHNEAIYLYASSSNIVSGNNITANESCGIELYSSSNNSVSGNSIANNWAGIGLGESSNNTIYHNNFVDNIHQVYRLLNPGYANSWDNGCDGNYWSNYDGTDLNGDGIGDAPYIIDESNQDNYPLMNLYWNPADIDHDLDVDIFDLVRLAGAYGSTPLDLNWNPHCDIAEPYGIINIFDIVTIAGSYGKEYGS